MSDGNKTDGKRNRVAGSNFEREVVRTLRDIGFNVAKSPARGDRDNSKVDIINEDEDLFGRLPYNIQCKTLAKHVDYTKVLAEMPNSDTEIDVILHRKTKKNESGAFIKQGTYAIMQANDFYYLIEQLENFKRLSEEI